MKRHAAQQQYVTQNEERVMFEKSRSNRLVRVLLVFTLTTALLISPQQNTPVSASNSLTVTSVAIIGVPGHDGSLEFEVNQPWRLGLRIVGTGFTTATEVSLEKQNSLDSIPGFIFSHAPDIEMDLPVDTEAVGTYDVVIRDGQQKVIFVTPLILKLPPAPPDSLLFAGDFPFPLLTRDGAIFEILDPVSSISAVDYDFDDFTWGVTTDKGTLTQNSNTFTVSGLDPGDDFEVVFRYTNPNFQAGEDRRFLTVPVIPDVPPQPTVVAGDQQVTVSIPDPNESSPPSFEATSLPDGQTCTLVDVQTSMGPNPPGGMGLLAPPDGGASSSPDYECVITGLTNGTAYTFTVTASNVAGTSAASTASAEVIPMPIVPDTPAQPTVVAGDGEATITVGSPSSGGIPDGYTVTADPGGATCTVTGASGACTVTGLTNETAYTFTVTATNLAGTSQSSTASASVTPRPAPPGVPGIPIVVRGDGEATVTVTSPSSGGIPDRYTVTATPDGETCTVTGASGACTVTGLTNGTPYTFTVTASNVTGTSAASTASAPVTPVALPGAPSALSKTHGNGQVVLTWTPGSDGGTGSLSGHLVEYSTDSGGTWVTAIADTNDPTGTATVTGLTNGTAYLFRVSGISSAGSGAVLVATSAVTPSTTPGAVSGLDAQVGDAEVTLTWTLADDGGAAITGYRIEQNDGSNWSTSVANSSSSALSYTVTGLTNGVAYNFRVVAINSNGASVLPAPNLANPVTPVEAPGVPSQPVAVAAAGSVVVTVEAGQGGDPEILTVTADPGGATCTITNVAAGASGSCTLTGLTVGDPYTFTATARNATATSVASTVSDPATPLPLPLPSPPPPPAAALPPGSPAPLPSPSDEAPGADNQPDESALDNDLPDVSSDSDTVPGDSNDRGNPGNQAGQPPVNLPVGLPPSDTVQQPQDGVSSGGAQQDSTNPTTVDSAPQMLAAPVTTVPQLLSSTQLEALTRAPGDTMLVVNGNPVAVSQARQDGPQALAVVPDERTPADVQEVRQYGQSLVAALQAVTASDVPLGVTVRDTPTGAVLFGAAVQPSDGVTPLAVPVEHVIVLATNEQAVLVAGVNKDDAPAPVGPSGSLVIDRDGYVAVSAYGLPVGAAGEVVVMSTPTALGTFVVGVNGDFSGQVQLPDGLIGEHTVVLAASGVASAVGVEIRDGGDAVAEQDADLDVAVEVVREDRRPVVLVALAGAGVLVLLWLLARRSKRREPGQP